MLNLPTTVRRQCVAVRPTRPPTLLTSLSFPGPTVSHMVWHPVLQGEQTLIFTPVKAEYLSPVHPNTLPHGVTPLHRRVEHRHLDMCKRRQRNEEKGPQNNPLSGGRDEAPPAGSKTRGAYSLPQPLSPLRCTLINHSDSVQGMHNKGIYEKRTT